MTPLVLIDCASSCSLASSTCLRGWNSFGARRSMSVSTVALSRGDGRSGISALRPLPSAGRFSMWSTVTYFFFVILRAFVSSWSRYLSDRWSGGALQHFTCERAICFGAARLAIVEDDRHAVARRLAEPDVA